MTKKKFDIAEIHAEITEGLIALMESGVAPWSKPWIVRGRDDAMMPRNGVSNRKYTGFNSMYLSFLVEKNGWNDPRFSGARYDRYDRGAQTAERDVKHACGAFLGRAFWGGLAMWSANSPSRSGG